MQRSTNFCKLLLHWLPSLKQECNHTKLDSMPVNTVQVICSSSYVYYVCKSRTRTKYAVMLTRSSSSSSREPLLPHFLHRWLGWFWNLFLETGSRQLLRYSTWKCILTASLRSYDNRQTNSWATSNRQRAFFHSEVQLDLQDVPRRLHVLV